MKLSLFWICLMLSAPAMAQGVWQLAPPVLRYHTIFFQYTVQLNIRFRQPGAVIRYTTNGSEPDEHSKKYKRPLVFNKQKTTVRVKAFAPGFRPSETVGVTFYKDGYPVKDITGSLPDPAYPGIGLLSLTDNMAGQTDLHSKYWCGYKADTVTYYIELEKQRTLHSLLMDFLQQKGSWIYLPESIHVSVLNESSGSYQPIIHENRNSVTADEGVVASTIYFPGKTAGRKLKVQIVPLQKIPAGLPGDKEKGWLFIDEIKLF